jgi:hypothetical protein
MRLGQSKFIRKYGCSFQFPLYYFYGIDAVVPDNWDFDIDFILFFYYSKKLQIKKKNILKAQFITEESVSSS